MKKETLALIALVILVVAALSVYLVAANTDFFTRLMEGNPSIEEGSYADVHYIARYQNGTIISSSYNDTANKTGGRPLKVFVTTNMTATPGKNFSGYANTIDEEFVEGFIDSLKGMKKGQTKTVTLPPEKAYGFPPKINDTIEFGSMTGNVSIRIIRIVENSTFPPELEELRDYYGWDNITTLYTIRDETHKIGENVEPDESTTFSVWGNTTVVTKINETLLWKFTTPPADKLKNLTWTELDYTNSSQVTYPANATSATYNDTHIVLTHNVSPGDNITTTGYEGSQTYIVDNVSATTIYASLNATNASGNATHKQFAKTRTIPRNQTQDITTKLPKEYLEMFLSYLRSSGEETLLSLHPAAGKTVIFDIEVVAVYKAN